MASMSKQIVTGHLHKVLVKVQNKADSLYDVQDNPFQKQRVNLVRKLSTSKLQQFKNYCI